MLARDTSLRVRRAINPGMDEAAKLQLKGGQRLEKGGQRLESLLVPESIKADLGEVGSTLR